MILLLVFRVYWIWAFFCVYFIGESWEGVFKISAGLALTGCCAKTFAEQAP